MFHGIFAYIDRIVHLVKPRQMLYMAIDGVAPRAKMNQQRSRRFRSAQDLAEAADAARAAGEDIDDDKIFDSNCITPGTEFMEKLSKHLDYFIAKKLREDSLWQRMKVIYSGHDVPGEGEHKIMDYIRSSKMQPGYPQNIRHCLYGLDADLVMLALVSHEPHFCLLREEIDFGFNRPKRDTHDVKVVTRQTNEVKWQLLHISLLRQYLFHELGEGAPEWFGLERAMDDFVFMCMLCGNGACVRPAAARLGRCAQSATRSHRVRRRTPPLPSWLTPAFSLLYFCLSARPPARPPAPRAPRRPRHRPLHRDNLSLTLT
jgi:5'-3' exoribonuclease 1